MKPESIAPQYESFPAELRSRPIWLIWNYRFIKKRWTKVPLVAEVPLGAPAKSNDATTWRSFEQAVNLGLTASGIGLCFIGDYCGVDLDCCRDPQSGTIADWAQKIVEHLDSYTEVSPSGTGLHIIVRLTHDLPEGRRKWGGKDKGWEIAVYDRNSPRYFCATGRFIEGRSTVRTCDPASFYPQFEAGIFVPSWAKAKPAEPAAAKPNGKANGKANGHDKMEALLRGEWQGLYPSQSEADAALVWYLAAEYGNDPAVIDQEFRKSGLMRDKWDKRDGNRTYGARTTANCLKKKTEPVQAPPVWTEDDLTAAFAAAYSDLRYVDDWKRWLCYGGTVWSKDNVRSVFDRARNICRAASAGVAQKEVGTLRLLRSAKTRAAVENMARENPQYAAVPEQFDASPWLLNTSAGTVDLESCELREHRADDYLMKTVTVAPRSGDCPLWFGFLNTITAGNVELQKYLQRVAGYCLTGITTEHVLFFLYGTGSNGKTTFTNTLLGIWGDYGQVAQMETFTETNNDRHPTELAALRGARLVVASETESGKRWAESRIKSLTGGEPIRARFMHCDEFEFVPSFKLMMLGNHKPGLRSVDEAIRRRLHLVPFTVTIPRECRDRKLGEKLKAEWPQILDWAIQGCRAWQSEGLNPPAAVRDATEEYFSTEDAILSWLEDRAVVSPQAGCTKSSVLYQDYKKWAERTGEFCGSQKRFSQDLVDRGFNIRRSMGKVVDGIQLRTEDQNEGH